MFEEKKQTKKKKINEVVTGVVLQGCEVAAGSVGGLGCGLI